MGRARLGSCEPWIASVSLCRCRGSPAGSCACPRALHAWATAAAMRVCARRSIVLSAHVAPSSDSTRDPAIKDMVPAVEYRMSRPARSPFWRSARQGLGIPSTCITWCGSSAGAARLRVHPTKPKVGLRTTEPTRSGTSTPRSSACSTGSSLPGTRRVRCVIDPT